MDSNIPSNVDEFNELAATQGNFQLVCLECDKPFSLSNVHTSEGWKETQLSGLCEDCFDGLFEDEGDPL